MILRLQEDFIQEELACLLSCFKLDEVYKDAPKKPLVVKIGVYDNPEWGLSEEIVNLFKQHQTDLPENDLKELHRKTGTSSALLHRC